MRRNVLYRGQTRRFGEKVNMKGESLPGNWVLGGICVPPGTEGDFAVIYGSGTTYREWGPGISCDKYTVYRDTIGEYIDVNDANNNMIFEDDVLRCVEYLYLVVKVGSCFYARRMREEKQYCFVEDIVRAGGVVIGNIHDSLEYQKMARISAGGAVL